MSKNGNIWIERELIESRAFAAIKKPTAIRVLMIFFTKRQMEKLKHKTRREWTIRNNGEIEFTYPEAENKYGIPQSTFGAAIDELREKGFIDVAYSGAGLYKSKNLYEISDRWRKYDTAEYEPPKPRPKFPINRGFKKGNQYGRNCLKIKTTVKVNNGSTVENNKG